MIKSLYNVLYRIEKQLHCKKHYKRGDIIAIQGVMWQLLKGLDHYSSLAPYCKATRILSLVYKMVCYKILAIPGTNSTTSRPRTNDPAELMVPIAIVKATGPTALKNEL